MARSNSAAERGVMRLQIKKGTFIFLLVRVGDRSRRIAGDGASGRHILVTTLPAPTIAFSPIGDATQQRRAGADRCASLDQGSSDNSSPPRSEVRLGVRRPRIAVVDESDAVSDEDAGFDGHAFADEGVARDLAALADLRALLDFDEGADLRFVADLAAVEIDESVNPHVPARASRRRDELVGG